MYIYLGLENEFNILSSEEGNKDLVLKKKSNVWDKNLEDVGDWHGGVRESVHKHSFEQTFGVMEHPTRTGNTIFKRVLLRVFIIR